MDENLKARRSQTFIDNDLQGMLLRRVAIYWLLALVALSIALLLAKLLWGAPLDAALFRDLAATLLPAWIIALLPLPLILRDILRASHRFAGPMLRIRRGLSDLAKEGAAPPITAREGDAWPDCIEDFNTLAKRLSPKLESRL